MLHTQLHPKMIFCVTRSIKPCTFCTFEKNPSISLNAFTSPVVPAVPADGVKGKTWGPSSGSHVTRVRPGIATGGSSSKDDDEDKWRASGIVPTVTSVPELGEENYMGFYWVKADLLRLMS